MSFMKSKTLSALLGLALLVPALLSAREAEPEHPLKPLLWKVEGPALAKPSYLFGTIHIGTGPVATLHPAAAGALEAADAVYTEVPMDAASQLGLAKHFIRTDGRKLSDSIGEELGERLDTELAAIQPGLNSAPFEALKTWAVAVTVPMLKLQLAGGKPLDMLIWEQAERAGKTMDALEKPEDQFGIFDDLSEEEQVILLAESLRMQQEARREEKDPIDDLVQAYVSGDAKAVEAEMERQIAEIAAGDHKDLGEKLTKRLLDDRNRNMADLIAETLREQPDQTHFFAVGAGHYVGDDNIGLLLGEKGLSVTRVED